MRQWIDSFIRRVRDTTKPIPIGPADDPILLRYFVIPRNRFLNVYLHCFLKSDDDRGLHDHRMANISVVLQGHYFEQRFVTKPVPGEPLPMTKQFLVMPMRPCFRRAATPHQVILNQLFGKRVGVWSLFIGFPHIRNWGFWQSINGMACWMPHECVLTESYQPREAA